MKMMLAIFALLLPFSLSAEEPEKTLYIYQDADLSNHAASSEAIQKGMELAFHEIGNSVQGYNIAFKYLDHRGNVIRSKRNYQTFIDDPKALAIFSGIHSPPLIKNRTFINENKALTLVPWAAGGPITRHPSPENWIFRLSVDDTQAGPVLVNFAMKDKKCTSPHLLLEQTPWGDSNLKSMAKALQRFDVMVPNVSRFSWGTKTKGARLILQEILAANSDCILFVGNAVESVPFMQEIANLPEASRLPIISHWGITGGDFHNQMPHAEREKIDLHMIQSCFAFTNEAQPPFAQKVFASLKEYTQGEITEPADMKAAAGFIHAYDLSRLLIQAIKQTALTGDMQHDRDTIRRAMENILTPVQGLIKTYRKPFSVFDTKTNFNAHEALDRNDYCMGTYGQKGEIFISQ